MAWRGRVGRWFFLMSVGDIFGDSGGLPWVALGGVKGPKGGGAAAGNCTAPFPEERVAATSLDMGNTRM